jgi:hypothetical protein
MKKVKRQMDYYEIRWIEDEKDKGFVKPKDKLWSLLSRQRSYGLL